jgi:uncharacterized membrane protein YdjX (TVP38/TMEM64 family)
MPRSTFDISFTDNEVKKETLKDILKLAALFLIVAVLVVIFWKPIKELVADPQAFREYILGFGAIAPLLLIGIVALQVIVAPIPGQVAGIAGGFLFGTILGTVYTMIGLVIGSWIAFILSRYLGRPFVARFVPENTLKRFDKLVEKGGIITLLMIYILPALPDDAICFVAGLTKIKIRTLMLVSFIGRLPGMIVLSLVGAGLAKENSLLSIAIFAGVILISILIFIFRAKIEVFMLKMLKKIQKLMHRQERES